MDTRDYQVRIAVKAINFALVEGIDSIMIESPTGSGKTIMGQLIVHYLQHVGYVKKTNWTAGRRELLNQAKKSTAKINAKYKMEYVSMFNKNPPPADSLVNDECQHDATESSSRQHIQIKPKFMLGLSATPYRTDSAKLFYKRVIRDANTQTLIKAGWLSSFNHYMIEDWNPITVAKVYVDEADKWGKSIVSFLTMEECEIFKQIVEDTSDRKVELVDKDSDRDTQIAEFENGDVDVLVNMMVLTEGFDCNIIHSVFIRDASKGPTRQIAGRGLRLNNGAVKNMIQSKETSYSYLKVADAKQKFIATENGWEEIFKNKNLNKMHNMAIDAIVETIKEDSKSKMTPELARAYKAIKWGIKGGKKKRLKYDNSDTVTDEVEL